MLDLYQFFVFIAVARSFSGVVAIRYVLPVLWMISHFSIMDRIAV